MMIEVELFTYSDEQWDQIRIVVRDALGLDADQIKREVARLRIGDEESVTEMQSLRDRIAAAAGKYPLHSSTKRQSLRRDELVVLRKSAQNMQASIIGAIVVPLRQGGELLLPGVDVDMPTDTSNYFRKLARNLDRMIEQAGQRGDNARKTVRDQCWSELLAIWREHGGKASGKAASFLEAASKPVMGSAVPDITSVRRWLERRKTANKVTKKVRRRATW
jgi:hypothetical protein